MYPKHLPKWEQTDPYMFTSKTSVESDKELRIISTEIRRTANDVTDVKNILHDQETRNIISWLSPLNFWIRHSDSLSRRHQGTGLWLVKTTGFQDWLSGKDRVLWCPGIRICLLTQDEASKNLTVL